MKYLILVVLLIVGCKPNSMSEDVNVTKLTSGTWQTYRIYDYAEGVVCYRAPKAISCLRIKER